MCSQGSRRERSRGAWYTAAHSARFGIVVEAGGRPYSCFVTATTIAATSPCLPAIAHPDLNSISITGVLLEIIAGLICAIGQNRSMPKRPLGSAPSTPRKRKAKDTNGQLNIDAFFRRSGSDADDTPVSKSPQAQLRLRPDVPESSSSNLSTLESDAALARKLAEEDGWSADALREVEKRSLRNNESRSNASEPIDVIDVDLLDEQAQTADIGTLNRAQSSKQEFPDVSSQGVQQRSSMRGIIGQGKDIEPPAYPVLSVDPVDYQLNASPWPLDAPAPYSFLAYTLCTLSGTKSRIAILNTLTNCLRTIIMYHPASLCPTLYLLSNSLTPPYSPLELGLGPSIISKAIQDVSGLTSAALKRLYNTTGDPGEWRNVVNVHPINRSVVL